MTEEFREEELLFLMKKINIDLGARLEKDLRKQDMSGTQVYFLIYILRHHPGGTYITELCHEIGISKATLSVLVKKLREKDICASGKTQGMSGGKRYSPLRSSRQKAANCSDRQSGWNLRSSAGWTEWRSSDCGNWSIRS